MTAAASPLGDFAAVRFYLNIVLVATRGEEKRMPEAVRCFRRIFADEVVRGVTAIARRNRAMR